MNRLAAVLVGVMIVALSVQATPALGVAENPTNKFHLGQFTTVLGGDPIYKDLEFDEDKNDDWVVDLADRMLYQAFLPLQLFESVQIGPGSAPWTDWHEEFLTENWIWTDASFSAPGLTGLSVSGIDSPTLDFYFDPLPPGTVIDIVKDLQYTGDEMDLFPSFGGSPVPGAVTIEVVEYPTPEPATCSLMVVAGLCLAFWAYRRRR